MEGAARTPPDVGPNGLLERTLGVPKLLSNNARLGETIKCKSIENRPRSAFVADQEQWGSK